MPPRRAFLIRFFAVAGVMAESIAVMARVGNKNIAAMRGRAGVLFWNWICAGAEFSENGISRKQKKTRKLVVCESFFVPREGVEPSRYRYRRILSPLRLPIPPSGQNFYLCLSFDKFSVKFRFFSPDSQAQFFILFFIIIFLFHNVKKTFSKRRMLDDRLIFVVAASIARFRECV